MSVVSVWCEQRKTWSQEGNGDSSGGTEADSSGAQQSGAHGAQAATSSGVPVTAAANSGATTTAHGKLAAAAAGGANPQPQGELFIIIRSMCCIPKPSPSHHRCTLILHVDTSCRHACTDHIPESSGHFRPRPVLLRLSVHSQFSRLALHVHT